MPIVLRVDGFAVRIFTDDHDPPHVHVVRAGAEVRVSIGSRTEGPRLLSTRGMDRRTARRALAVVETHQSRLLGAWERIHGSNLEADDR